MKNKKLSIGVVFGGVSSEYEISLLSATSILKNIDQTLYDIYMIGITKGGSFYLYTGEVDSIKDDKWQGEDCVPCIISPDHTHHGLLVLGEIVTTIRLDCIFPVLHGKNGEDGTIQGLFDIAAIPYVGCTLISSANCMDKILTKTILDSVGVKNSRWVGFTLDEYRKDKGYYVNKIEQALGIPCFVKPANAGSSVGITKAHNLVELEQGIELALANDYKVVVEEFVKGIELECGVLGNLDPIVSTIAEIVPCNEFYDYDAKYIANKTKVYIPARISEEAIQEIRSIAKKAFKALGCRGLARIDFFLTNEGVAYLNEPNTLPGFTSISMYPKLFEAYGIEYKDLITKLITLAMERYQL